MKENNLHYEYFTKFQLHFNSATLILWALKMLIEIVFIMIIIHCDCIKVNVTKILEVPFTLLDSHPPKENRTSFKSKNDLLVHQCPS